jgi:Tol biopolymer transport system component
MYSLNREQALYSVNGYETYLYDIKTGEKKYLFKGFNLEWSPKESKIKYCIPKGNKFDNFDMEHNIRSDSLETYAYDLNSGKSKKIADFYANIFFSYDDKRIIFYQADYFASTGQI